MEGHEEVGKNINPELKQQVLVPLSNLIEKYGIEMKLLVLRLKMLEIYYLLVDVAPVIKGLDYVSGKKNLGCRR